ncbi:MAG: efflux RND transporter periplasmic adaptor subunit [Marinibacterium sp.]|nr:efflux RND transporter periplasmic adaptor subunit [Marinibacterium sp.]
MAKFKVIGGLIVIAAAVGGYAAWGALSTPALIVQGEVEATRIDLAAKVSARVAQVDADFGDRVQVGDVLVTLDSPQLEAGYAAARAAVAVAEANRDLVFSTRSEVIDARRAELLRAEANAVLAQKTFDRISQLNASSTASAQRLDEAVNALNSANRAVEAARAALELAQNGSSPEERAVAEAQLLQARAAMQQSEANLQELVVSAPIDGQVTARLAEPGELFSAGAILMSVVDVDNAWFTFNIREDLLDGLEVGQELTVRLPALSDREVPAQVTAVNVHGSYANWRATKATGDFDLRTFAVRMEPLAPVSGLRPGMSALVDWAVQ